MLKKFSVENFKGFQDKITFDIGSPSNYNFNSEIIKNGCVTKGIIYGINSSGKSNLGLAIFDIITHLTDKQKLLSSYDFYLNMSGRKSFAEFEYTFMFDGHEVVYRYSKNDVNTLKSESLSYQGWVHLAGWFRHFECIDQERESDFPCKVCEQQLYSYG